MKLLALDLADRAGWASGLSGSAPESGTVVLRERGEDAEIAPGALGEWLFRRWGLEGKDDAIVVERAMNVGGMLAQEVVTEHGEVRRAGNPQMIQGQLLLHGALRGLARAFRIPVYAPTAATLRKHLCGQTTAEPPKRGAIRTEKERRDARAATKRMVIDRLILLKYLPADCRDDNRADAVAAFFWGETNIARATPKELVLFNA